MAEAGPVFILQVGKADEVNRNPSNSDNDHGNVDRVLAWEKYDHIMRRKAFGGLTSLSDMKQGRETFYYDRTSGLS